MIVAGLQFSKFRRSPSRRACRRGADSSGRAADNSPSFTRVSGEIEGLTQPLHPAAGPNGWSYAGDWVTRSIRRRGELGILMTSMPFWNLAPWTTLGK